MKASFRVNTPATLDVLDVLLEAQESVYCYALAREIQRPTGSVQPILDRLERHGWTTSEREVRNPVQGRPARRLYVLTDKGRELASELLINKHPLE